MRAETVSVGTEILLGQITDTNAVELGKAFADCGIDHTNRQTVGDNVARLTEALKLALSRSDIVVTIGGLGPTEDDLTRDGIAAALDDPLVHDPEIEAWLRKIFESRRFPWLPAQLRQAQRPSSATVIPNPNGTAPGLVCRKDGKTVVAMPGPRAEFLPMLENHVRPILAELGSGFVIVSKTLKIVGMGESLIEDKLKDLMALADPSVAPYAKVGEVHIRLTTKGESRNEGRARLVPVELEARKRLGKVVYGADDETLESVVIDLLRDRGATVATAESCTGGWLGQRITSVPGASDVYPGGVVSYANEAKTKLIGVRPETLERFGAVSEESAKEMATGVRLALNAAYGISITGIAGPDGGTAEKPVGLVFVGVATPTGVTAHRYSFPGTRDTVRLRSTQVALMLLRDALIPD